MYMKVPDGIKHDKNIVCKLKKSLYGLKQAARCWFIELDKVLKNIGFVESPVDRCIYFLEGQTIAESVYIVLYYVDNSVIVIGDICKLNRIKKIMMDSIEMVDLNELKLFLGIRITRYEDVIAFDQEAYINNILNKFAMENCRPINTPLETRLNFETLNEDSNTKFPIRQALGSLMYLMFCTRPDLSASVNMLRKYMNKNNYE